MDRENVVEKLMLFDLTKQESLIYLCLFENGAQTGYEVAKQTGISRSNVYNALASLTEKGAAHINEGSPVKYQCVAVQELCDNQIRMMGKAKEYLIAHLQSPKVVSTGYITIDGYKNILNKVYTMLSMTEYRLYLSAPGDFIDCVRPELLGLLKENKRVVIISTDPVELSGCEYYRSERREKQLRLIVDSGYVLTGDISGTDSDTCLYTGQINFVDVFKEAMRNEIELIKLKDKAERKKYEN